MDADSDCSHLLRLQGQKIAALQEYHRVLAKATGVQRYKRVVIADISTLGVGIMVGHKKTVIKQVMDVAANFFPESAWKIYMINAPMLFRAVWTVVKPWIHPITAAKINIVGSPKDALKQMEAVGIPSSSLPEWVGGTNKGVTVYDILNKIIKDNQAIASRCSFFTFSYILRSRAYLYSVFTPSNLLWSHPLSVVEATAALVVTKAADEDLV